MKSKSMEMMEKIEARLDWVGLTLDEFYLVTIHSMTNQAYLQAKMDSDRLKKCMDLMASNEKMEIIANGMVTGIHTIYFGSYQIKLDITLT